MPGLINLGVGLSALGDSVSKTAGSMAMEQQKENMEQQKLTLVQQLRATQPPTIYEAGRLAHDKALEDAPTTDLGKLKRDFDRNLISKDVYDAGVAKATHETSDPLAQLEDGTYVDRKDAIGQKGYHAQEALVQLEDGTYVDRKDAIGKKGRETQGQVVQLADGTYVDRKNAIGKKGPLSASRQAPITDENDPDAQAWFHDIANGNGNLANVPGNLKNVVARLMNKADGAVFTPRAKTQMTLAASRIAKEYLDAPQYKLTMNGLPYLQRIDAAFKKPHPGSVEDLALLDSMVKLDTAGNAVTEQQVKTITDGKSWADSVNVYYNKVKNGGVLSDNQRKEIHDLAGEVYNNYRKGFEPLYNELKAQLEDAGIPKQFWSLPDYNKLAGEALAGTSFADKPPAAPAGGAAAIPPVPSGVTPDLWQHMTPQERDLWK